jgi:hypothetical protein
MLRKPGKEFTLFQTGNGKWILKPVAFQRHKIAGTDHPSAKWIVNNEFECQPVRLRIESLMSVKPYNDKGNVLLTDFTIPGEFIYKESAPGVTGEIERGKEKNDLINSSGIFSARSTGKSVREGSWIKMTKEFDPWLDLQTHQALGVWIKGDGNEELINLRIESPANISMGARGDHFVKIDFTGWKYFELVEIESSEFNNYIWPNEYFNVYNSYFYTVKFNTIDKLLVWYNNLPADKEVKCTIGPVKALPMVRSIISNPSVTIGGKSILFPVKMESGMYLELRSPNDCKLYDQKGELIQEVTISGMIPELKQGNNEVSFTCDGIPGISSRVQVTVIGEGKPLR